MSLYVLDAFIWMLGIRGHIPHHGDFGPVPGSSPFDTGKLTRTVAAFVITVAFLSFVLWAVIWLGIKLL